MLEISLAKNQTHSQWLPNCPGLESTNIAWTGKIQVFEGYQAPCGPWQNSFYPRSKFGEYWVLYPPQIVTGQGKTYCFFPMGFSSQCWKTKSATQEDILGTLFLSKSPSPGLATSATCHSAKTSFCNGTAFVKTTPSFWPALDWPGGNCYASRPVVVTSPGTPTSASFLGVTSWWCWWFARFTLDG